VADRGLFRGGDCGNPTRTEGVAGVSEKNTGGSGSD